MNFKKGQTSLEYLLIVGGALVLGVFVVVMLTSTRQTSIDVTEEAVRSYTDLIDQTITPPIITSVTCKSNQITVMIRPSVTIGVNEYCLVLDDTFTNVCEAPQNNVVELVPDPDLTPSQSYKVSLVSKKTDNYSTPSVHYNCTAE
jgi:uncharacterized protein (UPF0333 family)